MKRITFLFIVLVTVVLAMPSVAFAQAPPAHRPHFLSKSDCEGSVVPVHELIEVGADAVGRAYDLGITRDQSGKFVAMLVAQLEYPVHSGSYSTMLVYASNIGDTGTTLQWQELVIQVFPCQDEFWYQISTSETQPATQTPAGPQCQGLPIRSGDIVFLGFDNHGQPMHLQAGGSMSEKGYGEYFVTLWALWEFPEGSGNFERVQPAGSVVFPEGADLSWRGLGAHVTVCNRELRYSVVHE